MAETVVNLPMLANGVMALGDMWDCRSSSCPGTLLNEPLSAPYTDCQPMQASDYTLRKIKDTATKLNELHIDASLKLDALNGKIVIEGAAKYDREEVKSFNQEELSCEYRLYTYKLRLRPNARDIFNKAVVAKLTSPKPTIAATHYVQEVVIGAHVKTKILYKDKVDKDNYNIEGSFKGKLELGPVSVEVKLQLQMLDKDEKLFYDTSISLNSSPPLPKTPTNVADMFTQIESIDKIVNDHKHYEDLYPGKEIVGVPLSFKLAPLSQFFGDGPSGVCGAMKQEIVDSFLTMVCKFQDFLGKDYLKSLIVGLWGPLATILSDPHNEYTDKITKHETALMDQAAELKAKSFVLFGKYQEGEATEVDLNVLIQENDKVFNIVKLYQKMNEYVREGKRLLTAIHSGDTYAERDKKTDVDGDDVTTRVKFFTNKEDLDDWWSLERTIKILMETKTDNIDSAQTGASSATGTFIKLFDLSNTLVTRHGVEVGVALPNISSGYSLTYKVGSRAVVYTGQDIQFTLDVLAIGVDKGEYMSTLFYAVHNALCGVYQPYQLNDLPSLVSVMGASGRSVTICESYIQLLDCITTQLPQVWTFVLPLEAMHTASDSVRFFRQMQIDLPAQLPGLEHRWIVGRFNSTCHDAPLLLVFRNGQLMATCLDHLDILALLKQLHIIGAKSDRATQFLKAKSAAVVGAGESFAEELAIVSLQNIRVQCLYPERANYILPLVDNLTTHHHQTHLYEPVAHLPPFQPNKDAHLLEAIEVARVVCGRRQVAVLSAVTRHAIHNSGQLNLQTMVLAPGQKAFGWQPSEQQFVTTTAVWKWEELSGKLDEYIAKKAPHLGLVQKGLKELEAVVKEVEYVPPPSKDGEEASADKEAPKQEKKKEVTEADIKEKLDTILPFILNSTQPEYTKLKEEIEKLADCSSKIKLYASQSAFQMFYLEALDSDQFHYINILKMLVSNLAGEKNTIQPLFPLVLAKYVGRLLDGVAPLLTETDYPDVPRLLRDALADGNSFRVLTLLSKCVSGQAMYKLHQELYNQSSITNVEAMKNCIEKMYTWKFDDKMQREVWHNPKFAYWIRHGLENEALLETIKFRVCITADGMGFEIPRWMPHEVAEKLQPLFFAMELLDYTWNKEWTDVESVIQVLQAIVTRRVLPVGFMTVFQRVLAGNKDLKEKLNQIGVLHYWNEVASYFDEPWSLRTVVDALGTMMTQQVSKGVATATAIMDADRQMTPAEALEWTLPEIKQGDMGGVEPIVANRHWKHLARADMKASVHTCAESNKISSILPRPVIRSESQLPGTLQKVVPYLFEKITGHEDSSDFEETSRIASFLNYEQWAAPPEDGPRPGRLQFIDSEDEDDNADARSKFLLSRGDLLTALCANMADPIMTLRVLRVLHSQLATRIALPLIVPDMTCEKNGAKSVLALLQQINIAPPSPNAGDWIPLLASKSRLITVVRVGEGGPAGPFPLKHDSTTRAVASAVQSMGHVWRVGKDSLGKSTILNMHVLNNPNFFSCRLESGSEHGAPLQRHGLVEFTTLSRETCSPAFWSEFGPLLGGEDGHHVYLANLHGDGRALGSTMKLLAQYSSSFIVFLRAADYPTLRARKKELNSLLALGGSKSGGHVLDLILDPEEDIFQNIRDVRNFIFTSQLHDQSTSDKFYAVFREALQFEGELPDAAKATPLSLERMQHISVYTQEVAHLVKFIQANTPSTVRSRFQELQGRLKRAKNVADYRGGVEALLNPKAGSGDTVLHQALVLFIKVLNLPTLDRFYALATLREALEQESEALRRPYVERILKLEAELLTYVKQMEEAATTKKKQSEGNLVLLNPEYVAAVQDEIKGVRIKRDSMSLPLEQFWKQLDYIIPLFAPPLKLPYYELHSQMAEAGWAMQLSDGDDGAENMPLYTSFRKAPIDSLFSKRDSFPHPDARVFVVSVLGLRSSGKSTLLNETFGPTVGTFPVGPAGCTHGLVFRIHILSPDLTDKLKLDILLVIDSEGVGSAESYLDEAANAYERELATFLLGISHLTLVHVVDGRNGRGFEELCPILEIAFTTLTTMEAKRPIRDVDMLFVHEPDSDVGQSSQEPRFLDEFKASVDRLTQWTQLRSKQLLIGVQTNPNQVLKIVNQRLRHDEILHSLDQTRQAPGARLLERILEICKGSTEERLHIGAWYTYKDDLYEKIKATSRQVTTHGIPDPSPRRVRPLLHASLQHLKNTADVLGKVRHAKHLIDIAFRGHAGVTQDKVDERLAKLFYDDATLVPYPKGHCPAAVAEEKAREIREELNQRQAFLWKTINTCDINASKPGGSGDSDAACSDCRDAFSARESLIAEIEAGGCGLSKKRQVELVDDLINYQGQVRDTIWARIQQRVFSTQLRYECIAKSWWEEPTKNGEEPVVTIASNVSVIPAWRLIQDEVIEEYCAMPSTFIQRVSGIDWLDRQPPPELEQVRAFDLGNYNRTTRIDSSSLSEWKSRHLDWVQNDWLMAKIEDLPAIIATEWESKQYVHGMIRHLQGKMEALLDNFEIYCQEKLDVGFLWEAHLTAIFVFAKYMRTRQLEWNENEQCPNHPIHVWNKIKVT